MGRKIPNTQAEIYSFEEVRLAARNGKAVGCRPDAQRASKRQGAVKAGRRGLDAPRAKRGPRISASAIRSDTARRSDKARKPGYSGGRRLEGPKGESRHAKRPSEGPSRGKAGRSGLAKLSLKVKERGERKRRERNHAKADRIFNKRYADPANAGNGSHNAEAAQDALGSYGPRAAVYKGEMGSSQKRSAKMQNRGAGRSLKFGMGRACRKPGADVRRGFRLPRKLRASLIALLAAVVAGVMLYGPAQGYYRQMRETDRLHAEYEAVSKRTEALEDSIDALQTDEGVEHMARTELGYVKRDEQAASVKGITVVDEGGFTSNIVPGSVPAPKTWYSPFLDPFFGYGT